MRQRTVGAGARAAVVLWRKGRRPPRAAVVFLHGFEPEPPSVEGYGNWIRHLTGEGNTVVYPVYRGGSTKPEGFLENAIAGIAAGLHAIHADPRAVVTIGHTTGGVLAVDYAAVAGDHGLPTPRGVVAVYPDRKPTPESEVDLANLSNIPGDTRLMVIAGPGDPIPHGDREARALLVGARKVPSSHRRFVSAPYVRSPGPFPKRLPPRRGFWPLADRVIAEARGGGAGSSTG